MASPLFWILVSGPGLAVDSEVQNQVNQFLASEKASERAQILRSLQETDFTKVETALKTGTTAVAQLQIDTVIRRTMKTDYSEQEFETHIYIPRKPWGARW